MSVIAYMQQVDERVVHMLCRMRLVCDTAVCQTVVRTTAVK